MIGDVNMMNRIGIIYFSGTGNTKFVAQNMKIELERYNKEVDLINIEKDTIDISDYKSLIIGGPVYVDRYPEILIKYMEENLQRYKGNCMLFTTQASDKESVAFQHFIDRLPFLNITYCTFITMPNNFYNFMFKMSSKEEEMNLIRKSIFQAKKDIKNFLNGRTQLYPKNNIYVRMIDRVYKMVYPNYIRFLTKKIKIDTDKCNKCKLCERRCPVNCIKISDKAIFDKSCIFCQRCINSCPNNAFYYKEKSIVQYNPNFRYFRQSLDKNKQKGEDWG